MVMLLDQQYREARQAETVARLRRGLTLRAMQVTGSTQREIATALGVSQPAVSKQLDSALDPSSVSPETLIEAAGPVLREIAHARGFAKLAVFGSIARKQGRKDSDVDLIIDAPKGTTIGDLVDLRETFARILERSVDLVTYKSLTPGIDDDIRREAVLL
jgi:predicted nucleotidyltransferase